MLISLITPTLNSAEYLSDYMRSVSSQEDVDIEQIIIDGGSTDGTLEIFDEQQVDYYEQESDGVWEAFAEGYSKASGDIIGVLNSDDYLYDSNVLSRVQTAFKQDEDLDFLYGNSLRVDADGDPLYLHQPSPELTLEDINNRVFVISHHTLFFRKRVLDEIDFIDPEAKWNHDLVFIRKLFKNGYKGTYLPHVIACFRLHGENASLHHYRDYPRELFKKWSNYPSFLFTFFRIKEALNHKGYLTYLLKRELKSWLK